MRIAKRINQDDVKTARLNDVHNCFVCRCLQRSLPKHTLITVDYHTVLITMPTGEKLIATMPTKVANLLRDWDFSQGTITPPNCDLILNFEPYTNQETIRYV